MSEFEIGHDAAVRLLGTLRDASLDTRVSFELAVAKLGGSDERADGFLAGLEDFLEFWEDSDSAQR